MGIVWLSSWIIVASLAIIAPSINADSIDEYWQQREKQAKIAALEAYHPNPEQVTNELNLHVHKALARTNNSSRALMKRYNGPCLATNPIDQCWRCNNDWAENRKRLADCVLGFGRKTTGGKNGKFYVVFNGSDDAVNPTPGTLRHAVIQEEPLWIIFNQSMIISLQQELLLTSDKTIDGRGANVRIAYGAGVTLQSVNNVIIHNIHLHDIHNLSGGCPVVQSVNHVGVRGKTDGDGISIFGSSNIWLDHLSMARCHDGLIDAIMGSTGITISNSHFTEHNDVMLFGGNNNHHDIDSVMQVTVAFNHFGRGLVQRMPRCRSGFFHVVNNDYYTWAIYAIGGSASPTIVSQGNRFIPSNNKSSKEVTRREETPEEVWKNWNWSSEGDLFVKGAFFVESGKKLDAKMNGDMNLIKAKGGEYASILTHFTGTIVCNPGQKC